MTPKDKEYESLRREIEKLLELEHSLYNILYVGATAILAWGIKEHEPFMCLLSYCIIFPSFYIMLSYISKIFKIGAYIYVYYEEYSWEKILHKINTDKKYKKHRYVSSYRTPFIFVSIMSTALSIIIAHQIYSLYSITYIMIVILSFTLLLSFIIYVFSQKNYDNLKKIYIEAFYTIKLEDL